MSIKKIKKNRKNKRGMTMLTWFVDQKDVDKNFSMKELLDFSKKHSAKVIIRKFCVIQDGGIIWMAH
ncbi:MAG: hypothetical protein ACTSQG_00240 [Promethearchaeota archaeon]